MKKLLFLAAVCCFPFIVQAQSLTVQAAEGGDHGLSTFTMKDGTVSLASSSISFSPSGIKLSGLSSYGISPDLSVAGVLKQQSGSGKAVILNGAGTALAEYEVIDYKASDPSLKIYPFSTGGSLVRDNIVSFNLYDPFGNAHTTLSSGGQSSGGQVISEVAMDAEGRTVMVYTPQIKNNGSTGSSAGRIDGSSELASVFYSRDRTIKDLQVSGDGQFVVLITGKEGTDDEALLMDRYGNTLNAFQSSEELRSASLSSDAQYLTVYSAGRAAVYETLSGERLGSTSFGSGLIMAHYFPDDEVLLALSGSISGTGKVASGLEFHAIHFGKREVERQQYRGSLGFNPAVRHRFERLAAGRYMLRGANTVLEISAQF